MAREPSWRTLVRELTAAGHESIYLDRLRRRLDVAQAQASLEKEIIGEMAAALGRAEDKLNTSLLRLEIAARALDDADPSDREHRAAVYDARHAEAMRARWELVIHREAVGIWRNDLIEQLYPIPPPRRRSPGA
jgi:hypothetical protein